LDALRDRVSFKSPVETVLHGRLNSFFIAQVFIIPIRNSESRVRRSAFWSLSLHIERRFGHALADPVMPLPLLRANQYRSRLGGREKQRGIRISRNWLNTINRADLAEAVRQSVRLSRAESAAHVELFMKEIIDCLARGEKGMLTSFGSFLVRKKGPRVGRNPQTGEHAPITPRRVIVFRSSGVVNRHLDQVQHKRDKTRDSATIESDVPE
jgi:integration host factor subunit alpha